MSCVRCDYEKCIGCLTCVVTCMDHHYAETETDAVSMRLYEQVISERTGMMCYKTKSCLHCANPACAEVCPQDVFYKDTDGFVKMCTVRCVGCGACGKACPAGAIAFDKKGLAVKCDGCAARVAEGKLPACVKACPTGALYIE